MNITIIGLGLLGGSFTLGLKEKRKDIHVFGVDINPSHCNKALELGIADEISSLEEAVRKADVVVLATPVNVLIEQLPVVLDLLPGNSIAIDFGSTKEMICQKVGDHPKRDKYVAMHPIAGTEYSGPEAAFPTLLHHQTMIICEKEKSDPDAVQQVEALFKKFNMHFIYMAAAEHDRHIAYVSHISHISSFALSTTVLEIEKDEQSIFELAGSGFASTVRLAKSSPEMWAPIFKQNTGNISKALGEYIKQLQEFKTILDNKNEAAAKRFMKAANNIKGILEGMNTGNKL